MHGGHYKRNWSNSSLKSNWWISELSFHQVQDFGGKIPETLSTRHFLLNVRGRDHPTDAEIRKIDHWMQRDYVFGT